jgi:beta-lactamase regulating signal transducer with metallopeptidase domain
VQSKHLATFKTATEVGSEDILAALVKIGATISSEPASVEPILGTTVAVTATTLALWWALVFYIKFKNIFMFLILGYISGGTTRDRVYDTQETGLSIYHSREKTFGPKTAFI